MGVPTKNINVSKSWTDNTGIEQDISTYMASVYTTQNSVELWDAIGKPLVAQYALNNDGAWPPSDTPVNSSFFAGQNATIHAAYPSAAAKRVLFHDWWNSHILLPSNETCTESILMHSLHVAPGTEKAQVRTLPPPSYGTYANYGKTPEIVMPIGQVQYWSPYTLKMEWIPVTVAFAAAKGCDAKLFDFVEILVDKGLVRETRAGKVAYPV